MNALHALADLTNPLQTLAILGLVLFASGRGDWSRSGLLLARMAVGLIVVYATRAMLPEKHLLIPAGGIYSTHSAYAVMATAILCASLRRYAALCSIGVLVGYLILIVYLGFHTAADVGGTLLMVVPQFGAAFAIERWMLRGVRERALTSPA